MISLFRRRTVLGPQESLIQSSRQPQEVWPAVGLFKPEDTTTSEMLSVFSTLTQLCVVEKQSWSSLPRCFAHAKAFLQPLLNLPCNSGSSAPSRAPHTWPAARLLPSPGPRGKINPAEIMVSLRTALWLLGKLQRTQKGFLLYLGLCASWTDKHFYSTGEKEVLQKGPSMKVAGKLTHFTGLGNYDDC